MELDKSKQKKVWKNYIESELAARQGTDPKVNQAYLSVRRKILQQKIHIIEDPENEYRNLTKALGGEIIEKSQDSNNIYNQKKERHLRDK